MEQIPHGFVKALIPPNSKAGCRRVNWQEHPGHFKYNEDDPHTELAEMRGIEKQLDGSAGGAK